MFSEVGLGPNNGEDMGKTVEGAMLTGTEEPNWNRPPSDNVRQKKERRIEIKTVYRIHSVAFLVDGKHVVGGCRGGKIRRWRVEDGREVGTPMDAGSVVCSVAVSRDGKWVVSGTESGLVTVWNTESYSKVTEWKAHNDWVRTVDVSPDAMKIASGSNDSGCTACVWSLSAGERLFEPFKRSILPNPFKHDAYVVAVKFSPDGQLIALAKQHTSVRICDGHNGRLLVQFLIKVDSFMNQSLAWAKDSKQLFVLSGDGNIYCLEASTGTTLSQWLVNSTKDAQCIAMASNGTFIAASGGSSVSFWDTTTHKKIECVIYHTAVIESMAISSTYDLVTAGGTKITVRNLRDVLPSPYCNEVSAFHQISTARNGFLITSYFFLTATAVP